MRRLLAELLTSYPETGAVSGGILRNIELLNAYVEQQDQPRLRRRGTRPEHYRVDTTDGRQELTERREASRPLRCPLPVYTATAAALRDSKQAIPFDYLSALVEKRLPIPALDHQIRVALRFWQALPSPLIHKAKARYAAIERRLIVAQTKAAWERFKKPATR